MASRMERRDRLLKKMAALPPAVRKALKESITQGADEITAMQRRLAPTKTGKLRASIKQTWGGGKVAHASVGGGGAGEGDPDLTVTLSAGDRSVRYAHLVEFGTAPHTLGGIFAGAQHPGTTARPFFFPAYRALRRRVKSRITRAAKKAARQVASQG